MQCRWVWTALLALGMGACSPAQTGVVIRVDSDLVRGVELQSVGISVTPEGAANAVLDQTYDLAGTELPLPGTVVVNAVAPDDARAMQITVLGTVSSHGASGTIERDFTVHFRQGHLLLLNAYLARRCIQPGGVLCNPGASTCGACDCDPVDPGVLLDYAPGSTTVPGACSPGDSDGGSVVDGSGSRPDVHDAGGCVPHPEICNGIDDDCNGLTDDQLGFLTCGTGACRTSVYSCHAGMPAQCVPALPMAERCNGVDDDCDGIVDDHDPCNGDVCARAPGSANAQWLCCHAYDLGFCPNDCPMCTAMSTSPDVEYCCQPAP